MQLSLMVSISLFVVGTVLFLGLLYAMVKSRESSLSFVGWITIIIGLFLVIVGAIGFFKKIF